MSERSGESMRRDVVQVVILLVMLCLAVILVAAWLGRGGPLVEAAAVLALLASVYALAQERRLKKAHEALLREVALDPPPGAPRGGGRRTEKVEFMKVEERLHDLTGLYRAMSAVNATSDHSQTYAAVLRAALDMVGGDCGSLMIVDAEQEGLTFASAVGLDKAIVAKPGPKLGEGIAGWVAEHGSPVLIKGRIGEDEGFKGVEERETALEVAVSIPIQLDKVVIGVLNLGATGDGGKQAFTDDDLRFATIFAQHAATAMARARLAEERERLRVMIRE